MPGKVLLPFRYFLNILTTHAIAQVLFKVFTFLFWLFQIKPLKYVHRNGIFYAFIKKLMAAGIVQN
ncbi:hypothetical protein C0V77_01350 [Emticicia sp. TH156]|nr:hypothetical protein C0V77_01350 [Emticicia sp. TH156]